MAEVTAGLDLLAGDPSLTFIAFVAMVLATVVAVRFGYYAARNRRASVATGGGVLWEYLLAVGVVTAVYGLVGVLEIVTSVRATFKQGLMLAVVLLLALAFAGYGFRFGVRQTAAAVVQGTMIDSLLRHLLPVLAFAALVPAVDLATVAGLPRAVVMHLQVVFVIMTATALMTATIKLRQNLATL